MKMGMTFQHLINLFKEDKKGYWITYAYVPLSACTKPCYKAWVARLCSIIGYLSTTKKCSLMMSCVVIHV